VYLPLDKEKLDNLGNLEPRLMVGLEDVDPGNAHTVAHRGGTTAVGISVGMVRQAPGEDVPLDSWSPLLAPAIGGKLQGCGVAVLDVEQEAFAAALIWKRMDPNGHDSSETEVVTEVYKAIKPHLRYFNSARYVDDLANGDLCLTMGYSGDIAQAA